MKTSFLLSIWLTLFAGMNSFAQMPEKPADISPLLCGEQLPDVSIVDTEGTKHELSAIISNEPTVLLFYRGGWCPYCNAHLSEIQSVENEIVGLGYQIVAISPDSPENLIQSAEKDKLNYSLYSDADGALIRAMGIAYKAPNNYTDLLSKSSEGLNTGFLPVPSVFVVNKSGNILFEYINPDYKTRLSSGLLLAVLKALKETK